MTTAKVVTSIKATSSAASWDKREIRPSPHSPLCLSQGPHHAV
jgi:hypothetical protein